MLTPARTVSRRGLLLGTASGFLLGGGLAVAQDTTAPTVVDVAPFRLRLPTPVTESDPLPGWSWAGRTSGAEVQVLGGMRSPSPELLAAGILGASSSGRLPLAVTGNPAQSVRGADDHVVWSVEQRAGAVRTGMLVAVTSGSVAGALLVLGDAGWSPGLRRTILTGVEVVRG